MKTRWFVRSLLAFASAVSAFSLANLGSVAQAQTQPFTITGMIGGELSYVDQRVNVPGFDHRQFYPALIGELNFAYSDDTKRNSISIIPFGHLDFTTSSRTYVDLREANYQYRGDGWSALAGVHRVYWGVVESRRLVNVINQVDGINDFYYGEEYLGQLMGNVALFGDWGRLELYAMTWFRDRRLPKLDFSLPPLVRYDRDGQFESGKNRWTPDFAARYQNKFGPVDIGLAYFHGTNREPQVGITVNPAGVTFRPFYERMDQVSVDAAWALGDLVLKGEALYRFNQNNSFFAAVLGGEYTFRKVFGGGYDVGLVAEYNLDKRDQDIHLEDLGATSVTLKYSLKSIYNHDAFIGARLTFNDSNDSTILAGVLVDVKDGATYISGEASTRLFDAWRVEAKTRYNLVKEKQNVGPFGFLNYTYSWAQLRVMRYF